MVSIPKIKLQTVAPTPGPYRLTASKHYTFEIRGLGGKLIAWTMESFEIPREEALANARLIVMALRKSVRRGR